MKSAIHTKRKIDAVISIRQDNTAKKITITNMNAAAERLVGYSAQEAVGKTFNSILSPRVNEILDEYLEFGNNASDFALVARRIPNFQVRSKKGDIISASLKVFNLVGHGNIQEYELLMRDVTLIEKIAQLKEIIMSNPGEIQDKDQATGLPSINTVVYAIDTSYSFLQQHSAIDVCFALVEISNFPYYRENHSEYIASNVASTLGSILKKCLRTEDVIGYMGDGIMGLVLIDCNIESAKAVFGRMKKKVETAKITMKNGQPITIPMAIAYTQINKNRDMTPMINACEDGLNRIAQRGGEGMVQV